MANYPQRIGEPECRDFLRTGRCKYGSSCKYHHPIGGTKAINPNEPPFPIRPGEPTCQYYLKNATCKFGQTCKFHHPPEILLAKGNYTCTIVGSQKPSITHRKNQQSVILDGEAKSINDRPRRDYADVLPQRPGEPDCIYYLRNGKCKYGASCKYHHAPRMNNAEDAIITPSRSHAPGISAYGRQRSCSDSIVEGHELQTYLLTGMLSQKPTPIQAPIAYVQESSVHRTFGTPNPHLSTINNSFHHYPPSGTTDPNMANNINMIGNFIQPMNSHNNSSPKMGSPSISSTTVASSYDTSSLETLPPSRVSGQTVIGSASPGIRSQRNSSSDLPKLSLSQGNVANGQQYLHRTNSKDDMVYFPHLDGNNLTSRGPNSSRLQAEIQMQLHSNSFQYGPQAMIQSQSSNASSLASVSPKESNNKKSPNLSSVQNNTSAIFKQKPNRSVDDGLSMMTDALLNMLDTPQENVTNGTGQPTMMNGNSLQDFLMDRRRRSSQHPARNSLPENLLSESANRVQQMDLVSSMATNFEGEETSIQSSRIIPQSHISQIAIPNDGNRASLPVPDTTGGRPPTHFFMPSP